MTKFKRISLLITTFFICMTLTAPALAHHPIIAGTVECHNGYQVITWQATNSETVSGSNRTMTFDQASVSSGSLSGFGVGTSFAPQPVITSTRVGHTVVPGTQTGTVTLDVRADWSNDGPQNVSASTTVTLPHDCPTPTTTTTHPTTTTTRPTTTTTTSVVKSTTTTTEEAVAPTEVTQPPRTDIVRTGTDVGWMLFWGIILLIVGYAIFKYSKK